MNMSYFLFTVDNVFSLILYFFHSTVFLYFQNLLHCLITYSYNTNPLFLLCRVHEIWDQLCLAFLNNANSQTYTQCVKCSTKIEKKVFFFGFFSGPFMIQVNNQDLRLMIWATHKKNDHEGTTTGDTIRTFRIK